MVTISFEKQLEDSKQQIAQIKQQRERLRESLYRKFEDLRILLSMQNSS